MANSPRSPIWAIVLVVATALIVAAGIFRPGGFLDVAEEVIPARPCPCCREAVDPPGMRVDSSPDSILEDAPEAAEVVNGAVKVVNGNGNAPGKGLGIGPSEAEGWPGDPLPLVINQTLPEAMSRHKEPGGSPGRETARAGPPVPLTPDSPPEDEKANVAEILEYLDSHPPVANAKHFVPCDDPDCKVCIVLSPGWDRNCPVHGTKGHVCSVHGRCPNHPHQSNPYSRCSEQFAPIQVVEGVFEVPKLKLKPGGSGPR